MENELARDKSNQLGRSSRSYRKRFLGMRFFKAEPAENEQQR